MGQATALAVTLQQIVHGLARVERLALDAETGPLDTGSRHRKEEQCRQATEEQRGEGDHGCTSNTVVGTSMPQSCKRSVKSRRMPDGQDRVRPVVPLEHVLQGDDVALHAEHLGDVGDATAAVAEPLDVDDEVECRGDLLPDGPGREVEAGHEHHRLDAGQRVTRGVGVDRGERAVVAGVHGLEHVEGLGAADLADDDAVGPHAQACCEPGRGS